MPDLLTIYVAVSLGYWGKGASESAALAAHARSGARGKLPILMYRNDVTADDVAAASEADIQSTPYVDRYGTTNYFGTLTKVAEYKRGKRTAAAL